MLMLLSSSLTHQINWSFSVLSFWLFLNPSYAQQAFFEDGHLRVINWHHHHHHRAYQWIIEFFNEQWMWPHSDLQLDQPAIIASVEGGKVHATVKQTLLEYVIVFIMRSKNYVWNNRIIFTHVHVFPLWRPCRPTLVGSRSVDFCTCFS